MKIAFVGLGIMGESMCENIIKKHDDTVYVFDVVPEKTEKLAKLGGCPCGSALEAAEKADVFISMVPRSEHSRAVYTGILPALKAGKTCIDMSTIDPAVSVEISEMVKATGAEFIDAPVVKSKPAAIAGKLGIYVGGSEEAYEKMRPILLYMGENEMLRLLPFWKQPEGPDVRDGVIPLFPEDKQQSFNNFRRAAGCGPAEFLAEGEPGDPVEQAIGARFDRTEVRDYYGRKYFIGDSLNAKGECLLRTIAVEKMVHWPTYVFGDLLWEHLKHFARNPETGELMRV